MRLFVSYARVDKPFCEQIVNTLDVHDVWYDRRVHVGKHWWNEIVEQLHLCDGFIYLLSPDSVKSEYCQREFDIALQLGKHIFPVLIHQRTAIPSRLQNVQYVDFSLGLTPDSVKILLNSIHRIERQEKSDVPSRREVYEPARPLHLEPPTVDPYRVIEEAADSLDAGEYDRAVFLLKQARAEGYVSPFIRLDSIIAEAEDLLREQSLLREAEREYQPIAALVKHERTRLLGCKAFNEFRRHFPDYDPDNLAAFCSTIIIPMLEWCDIPAGRVMLEYSDQRITTEVAPFRMGKYPITNDQFQVFVMAPDGYTNIKWWDFSPDARQWRRDHPVPTESQFAWSDHPRQNVCWYEAMAFCRWLSYQLRLDITLPTEEQWQWAAQGGDGRLYPWGNEFDPERCNTSVSKIRMTTPVTQYAGGVSPFGVWDMTGNVWNWCLNSEPDSTCQNGRNGSTAIVQRRAVRGGAFISAPDRTQNHFHYYLNPEYLYATIGFRVVCSL